MPDREFKICERWAAEWGVIPALVYGFFWGFNQAATGLSEEGLRQCSAFVFEGRVYKKISLVDLQREMPFLSVRQIRDAIGKLIKFGSLLDIKTGRASYKNEGGFMGRFDQTKAYSVAGPCF